MAQDQLLGITQSLFGVTPTYEQEFGSALQNFKGATASSLGAAAAYAGAKQAGRGLMQAVGVEDPEMASANRAKQLAAQLQQQGVSMQSSQGLRMLAQKLSEAGDFKAAQAAAALASNFETKETETGLKKAQTFQAVQKGIQATREKDPEIIRLQNARDELEQQYGPDDRRVVELNNILKGKAKAGQTNIDLGGVFDKAFTTQEAKDQADNWTKAGLAYSEAAKLSRNVRDMENIVGNSFVGSYGSLKAGVSRAFGGGKKLEDTEVLDALSAQLVLPLAKLLPGSLAVKELDQLIKTKPNLSQQEGTIRRLLGQIKQDLQASEITYEAGERYRSGNKGSIVGFNPNIANNRATRYVELQNKYNSGKPLSDAEKKEAKAIADELQIK